MWLLHLDTKTLTFFVFFLVTEAPLRCHIEVDTKHSYERVFSAVCFKIWYGYKVKPEQQPDFPCKI